jgi:glycosyltransferase involved in cell wall biosynthesis
MNEVTEPGKLRIWLITVGEPLPAYSGNDRLWRSGYLAHLLAARGYEVIWWASSFDHFRREQLVSSSNRVNVVDNLSIQFLRGCAYRRNVSIARQINHWQIAREFRCLAAATERPGVILCSFPTIELSREATRYGRAAGVPVFIDIRDLWPDELLGRLPGALQTLGRWALTPLYASARRAMQDASGLVAISERFLQWGLTLGGRNRMLNDRVFPMSYTGTLDTAATTDAMRATIAAMGVDPSKKIFWFAGTFVGNIDLATVIEAARILRGDPRIQFVLTGSGEHDGAWRSQAQGLDNVVFTGWADNEALAGLASMAWAGLGAYRSGARMTLPNKVFEYMGAGLPVLLSLEGETRELVVGNDIGVPYAAGDPVSLAEAVRGVADDEGRRHSMSRNAVELFRIRFSPETIYNRYADFLASAAAQRLVNKS